VWGQGHYGVIRKLHPSRVATRGVLLARLRSYERRGSARQTGLRPCVRSGSFGGGTGVVGPGDQTGLRPCVRSSSFSKRCTGRLGTSESIEFNAVSRRIAGAPRPAELALGRPYNPRGVSTFRGRLRTHAWAKPGLAARSYTLPHLLATFRERSRPHAWAKPGLIARTYNACTPSERSRAHAWAKPCLAGRPTMLVRTQYFEKNTSRGRPSGMELPDYPVVALTPHRRTRMGPHSGFPPGLFPDP
jgi:hypothetical protein